MNKNRLLMLAALTAPLPLAVAEAAETRFVCNQSGSPVLAVQYDGPRYADSISLSDFDGSLVRKLLSAAERSLRLGGSHIQASLRFGSCTATPTASPLLRCDVTAGSGLGWAIATYDFNYSRSIGSGGTFYENVSIERGFVVERIQLSVTKQRAYDPVLRRDYTAAHVRLDLAGRSPFASVTLTEERTLGELVPEAELNDWNRCAFVK